MRDQLWFAIAIVYLFIVEPLIIIACVLALPIVLLGKKAEALALMALDWMRKTERRIYRSM